ncbi:MAG: YwaF family protein [Clostridia bacterium]|nr:YwaF family protein [Clostridia bacterium]
MMDFFTGAGEAQGAYSWQHLTFVSSLMVIMVVAAVLLGRHFKNKGYESKNRVLIWTAIIIDALEIFKIVLYCILESSFDPIRRLLPFFLCSIQLIAIPVAAFSKGKLKNAALDFVCIFGILGALAGTFGAAQNYGVYPVLSYPNVHSGLNHSLAGFASLYIFFSGMASMRKENMSICLCILTSFCIVAYIACITLDYNYMFLLRGDGTPYDIFYNLVGGHPFFYPVTVVGLFFVYVFAFYGIYFAIKGASRKVVLKEVKESTTEEAAAAEVANEEESA